MDANYAAEASEKLCASQKLSSATAVLAQASGLGRSILRLVE
jgi:hypothetical protein